jgi:hypothetical protein
MIKIHSYKVMSFDRKKYDDESSQLIVMPKLKEDETRL